MKKVRFATVGIGRKGSEHIANILERCPETAELAAVCDHAPDRLAKMPPACGKCAEAWEKAEKYPSPDEMLKDPSIDLVTIAVRHCDHVPMAIRILEAGKSCGIEKPVATSVKEMMELKKYADKHPGKLFLLHNRRFEPAFMKAKELIDSGMLGTVNYVKLYRSVGYQRRNDWMTVPEYFGGLLSNWGPHLIDQALRLLDAPVTEVWADVRHCISIGEGDDLFKILIRAENGRLADIEVTGANVMPGREMEIICSRGTVVYEGGKRIHVRMVDPSIRFADLKVHRENPPFKYGNFDETLSFVDADYDLPQNGMEGIMWPAVMESILTGKEYPVKFGEGLEVIRVTEEAIRKSRFAPLAPFAR